ncbi:hypothetical protein [Vibrio phage phiKT1019]|nr:hypothetical protein [Vibrio phage phiKT1019]
METNTDSKYLTVPFIHVIPNNEHISQECYYRIIECGLTDIYTFGSYQPTILAKVVENVMDEMQGLHTNLAFSGAFDEVYGDLYSFLEDFLMDPINHDSLSALTTLSGAGSIWGVQNSPTLSNIILLVKFPATLVNP